MNRLYTLGYALVLAVSLVGCPSIPVRRIEPLQPQQPRQPQQPVTISMSFQINKYEVTQAEYQAVMGTNPSRFKGDNLPVENVSWYDAIAYCNALSLQEGLTPAYTIDGTSVTWDKSANGYRLPTEAEWEWAARGGNLSKGYKYAGSNNLGTVAWYSDNSGGTTHPVGTKAPNELGLCDMSGNVWEWCWDSWSSEVQADPPGASSGSRRVIRGGGWLSSASNCAVSDRNSYTPDFWDSRSGFRVVSP